VLVVAGLLLLLLLVERSLLFLCLFLSLRPTHQLGSLVHWRGLGSFVGELAVVEGGLPILGRTPSSSGECGCRNVGLHSWMLLLVVV